MIFYSFKSPPEAKAGGERPPKDAGQTWSDAHLGPMVPKSADKEDQSVHPRTIVQSPVAMVQT